MANVFASDYRTKSLRTIPNAWAESYSYQGAAASGDKIYFGIIPAGVEVEDVDAIFDDCGTGVTLSLGYEPVGTLPAAALTAFFTTIDVATAAGRQRYSGHPIKFDQDVKLVGTVGGAAFTGTPKVTAKIGGRWDGKK